MFEVAVQPDLLLYQCLLPLRPAASTVIIAFQAMTRPLLMTITL